MAAVLLLPVYGVWLDIRYAERQPTHKHIYLGKVNLNHHRTPESKNVVNLPDQDAGGQLVLLVCLPDEQIAANSAVSNNLSFALSDDCLLPEDAYIPPPDHPPRI